MSNLSELQDFSALKVSLASPKVIRSWSRGEVTEPETINYRTFRAEKDGLFCEKIFGPTKDFECYCGKYKKIRFKGVICDKCGVEVTRRRVRRERMGHVELASPCAHIWFFGTVPSKMSRFLGISFRDLRAVVYYSRYLVISVDEKKKEKVLAGLASEVDKGRKGLEESVQKEIKEAEKKARKEAGKVKDKSKKEQLLLEGRKRVAQLRDSLVTEQLNLERTYAVLEDRLSGIQALGMVGEFEYFNFRSYLDRFCEVKTGSEAVRQLLEQVDLEKLSEDLQERLRETGSKSKRSVLIRRLKVVEEFRRSGVRPEWMVLEVLPVIPPELRPMVQLEGGRFATSDLNDLYRAVINRNNRLKDLLELGAPELILRNERRMLQEAVDALIDGRQLRKRKYRGRKELRSLSELIKGKQGRFRRNLLGKRVDYSGRSVIVVGSNLKLSECGVPKEMALELFKPMVLREILLEGLAPNVKVAREFLKGKSSEVWDLLERVVENHPVLLNRAPTLHRLGILAFYPRLLEGKALSLHPCVCAGYNADFDGDQMAIHVPLSKGAIREAKELMLSTVNLLKPASGAPVTVPSKDMVLGFYWLTLMKGQLKDRAYTLVEAEQAVIQGSLGLRQPVRIEFEGEIRETTLGRIFFNQRLPSSLRFVNQVVNGSVVKDLLSRCLEENGEEVAVELIDALKDLGFKYSTYSGISMGAFDTDVDIGKEAIVGEAGEEVEEIEDTFNRGLITREEMLRLSQEIWLDVTGRLDELAWEALDSDNPVRMLIESGARGSKDQVKQLAGMKGLVVDPTGKIVELPTKSNYFEGLSEFEYFAGTRGSRKGLADTALRTADAGYLTRRLVDVAQEVLVREEDCGTSEGWRISQGDGEEFGDFAGRLVGRLVAATVKDESGKIIARRNALIDKKKAAGIVEAGVTSVLMRSPLTCQTAYGVCQKCYGWDLGWGKLARIGSPVGVIAAQSVGEPGTQLTLHGKQAGRGIVGAMEITRGLPRVAQLFEARTPKVLAAMSKVGGRVSLEEVGEATLIRVVSESGEEEEHLVPPTYEILVGDGDLVPPGQALSSGYLDPREILKTLGLQAVQKYLLSEIQKVYSSQGVGLNSKHLEVCLRQMFSPFRVISSGDTNLLPGEVVGRERLRRANGQAKVAGGEEAETEQLILGVTKVSLQTESWLSAASFQSTARILTDAAAAGAVDYLRGLKESVIVGRRIPVGFPLGSEGEP